MAPGLTILLGPGDISDSRLSGRRFRVQSLGPFCAPTYAFLARQFSYSDRMKLKQRPDDFRVEEFPNVSPGTAGPFSFYRLEKRGWTTPDALAAVRRRWKVDHRR